MSVVDDGNRGATKPRHLASRIERAAQQLLKASSYQALRRITCRERRGELVLTGEVRSYFHKQLAQEALRTFVMKYSIRNQIAVTSHRQAARAISPAQGGHREY